MQFSIRNLLLLTTVAAVYFALVTLFRVGLSLAGAIAGRWVWGSLMILGVWTWGSFVKK